MLAENKISALETTSKDDIQNRFGGAWRQGEDGDIGRHVELTHAYYPGGSPP